MILLDAALAKARGPKVFKAQRRLEKMDVETSTMVTAVDYSASPSSGDGGERRIECACRRRGSRGKAHDAS